MPSAYSKMLMPTLAARLEEHLGSKSRQEQLELYDEIAAGRMIAEQMMTLMNATLGCEKIEPETRISAMRLAQDSLNSVCDMVSKMAKIERDAHSTVTVEALGFFVQQVTDVIYRVLSPAGRDDLAEQISKEMQTRVRLPGAGSHDDPCVPIHEVELSYG